MADLLKLPTWDSNGRLYVVVETPKGARAKLKYMPDLQVFLFSRSLMLGLTYPYDWGFAPSTVGEDGDPVDVMVLHDAATSPGLVLQCKPIGVLEVLQREPDGEKRNDRVLAVPLHDHAAQALDDSRQLSLQVREELQQFFVATDEFQDKTLEFLGWRGPEAAKRLIESGAQRFKAQAA